MSASRLAGVLATLAGLGACSHGPGTASGAETLEEAPPSATAATLEEVQPVLSDSRGAAATGAGCGHAGAPDCPLQAWMKANMARQAMDGDVQAIARGLGKLAGADVPGFPDWGSIARAGAEAARRGDLEGARQSCKQCHETYRARYRSERRAASFR